MPKTFVIVFACAGLVAALTGCTKNTATSGVVPTAPTPIPTGTTATITVKFQSNPVTSQPVIEFNTNGSATNPQPSGAAIATQNTDANGQTTFIGLTPGTAYCWQAQFTPSAGSTVTDTFCGSNWAAGVQLGS